MTTRTELRLAREIEELRRTESRSTPFSKATVLAVDYDTNEVTLDLNADEPTTIPIAALGNYIPNVGHEVVLAMNGRDPIVIAPPGPLTSDPPAAVGGLVVTPGIESLIATWTGSLDPFVMRNRGIYEIEVDTVNTFDVDPTSFLIAATRAVIPNLEAGTTYYVRVRAVAMTGEEGAWSSIEDGVPIAIETGAGIEIFTGDDYATDLPALPDAEYPPGTFVSFVDTDTNISKLYKSTESDTWEPAVNTIDLEGEIQTAQIADAAIVAAKIGALAVEAGKIAANAVGSSEISADSVGTSEIAALSVTAAEIAANTITAGQIAASTITTTQIAANTITAADIAAGTITATEIAALTIVAGNIAASTITGGKIAASTITGSNIAANTIAAGNIVADTITASEIAASAIGTTELAADSVVSAKIAANTIVAGDIAASTITGNEIAAATITATNIAADTITATQIAALAIGTSELAADSVTAAKLAAISLEVGKYVRSTNYVAGTSGWTINADGTAEFAAVVARGVMTGSRFVGAFGPDLIPNGTFETNVTGWTAVSGCSIARSTAQAASGVASMLITQSAASSTVRSLTGTSGFPVLGGQTYELVLSARAGTFAGQLAVNVVWYDSAGATVSTSTYEAAKTPSGAGWTLYSRDWSKTGISWSSQFTDDAIFPAPATAAYAAVELSLTGGGNTQTLYIDSVSMEAIPAVGAWTVDAVALRAFGTMSDNVAAGHLAMQVDQILRYPGTADWSSGYMGGLAFQEPTESTQKYGVLDIRPAAPGVNDAVAVRLVSKREGSNGYSGVFLGADRVMVRSSSGAVTETPGSAATGFQHVGLESGWTPANETWTYASGTGALLGTFTISGDVTSKYTEGMRVRFTQSATVKYGIIRSSSYSAPNTTVTVQMQTDTAGSVLNSGLANSAITANSYSVSRYPAGFPQDPRRWIVGGVWSRNASLTVNNATVTSVTWNVETRDSDGFLTPTASVFTVPAGLGGRYKITAALTWSGTLGAGGAMWITAAGQVYTTGAGTVISSTGLSITVDLAAGDVFEVSCFQNSGAGRTVNPARIEVARVNW